jgi:hypothetical protein
MSRTILLATAAVEDPGGSSLKHCDPAIRTDAVHVVFTSIEDTLAAVRVAGDFAKALGVPLTLTHFRTVPFALPLDEPGGVSPIETDAFLTRLRAEGLDMRVRVHLCRDDRRAMRLAFRPQSLIVVAGRRRWWPTESARWCRMLEAAGHFVLFVDTAEHGARGPRARPGSSTRQPDWGGQWEPSSAAA